MPKMFQKAAGAAGGAPSKPLTKIASDGSISRGGVTHGGVSHTQLSQEELEEISARMVNRRESKESCFSAFCREVAA